MVEHAIAPLGDDERPLATFALLVARAPYRVDKTIVNAFRGRRPLERDLLGAAAWARIERMLGIVPHLTRNREVTAAAAAKVNA